MKWAPIAVAGLGLCILSTGCGPVVSGVEIVKAGVALSSAETAGAKEHARYEYTASSEYLHKAREEHGYAEFHAARIYAEKALDYAMRARKKAAATAAAGQPVLLPEDNPQGKDGQGKPSSAAPPSP